MMHGLRDTDIIDDRPPRHPLLLARDVAGTVIVMVAAVSLTLLGWVIFNG
jgi:hypothetical protein